MEPIELIMKIWGIAEEDRDELEDVLKNTPPAGLGLSLMNLGAADEEISKECDAWMETYLPELRFG